MCNTKRSVNACPITINTSPLNEDDSQPASDLDRGGVSELCTNMLSVVKPVVESSQNLSEHPMRLQGSSLHVRGLQLTAN